MENINFKMYRSNGNKFNFKRLEELKGEEIHVCPTCATIIDKVYPEWENVNEYNFDEGTMCQTCGQNKAVFDYDILLDEGK